MKNLLYKEFRLAIHPLFFLMPAFGALVLIPQWLYFFAPMYFFFISVPNVFSTAKAQNDIMYSAMLPVRRSDIVKARVTSMVILELIQILVTSLFAAVNMAIYPEGNFLMDANIAYIGFLFMIFGLFNIIMFPLFYRTAYKIALPTILSTAAVLLVAAGIEMLILFVPAAKVLDGTKDIPTHLGVLAGGIVLFFALSAAAYRISVKRFASVNL